MYFRSTLVLAGLGAALAQTNGCKDGFTAGTDTVLYTIPYTYSQVLSIIGSYKNLTWSGNPPDTVTLNGVSTIHHTGGFVANT
jgi:hypothetical protein